MTTATATGIDFSELTDAQLTDQLAIVTAQNAKTEIVLRTGQRIAADLVSEQSRRRLAAYWAANSELAVVKEGDKLLVTPAFHDTIFKLNCWPVGTILTVEVVNYNSGEDDDEPEQVDAYVRGDDGFTGMIYDWQMEVARTAYRAAHDAADGNAEAGR